MSELDERSLSDDATYSNVKACYVGCFDGCHFIPDREGIMTLRRCIRHYGKSKLLSRGAGRKEVRREVLHRRAARQLNKLGEIDPRRVRIGVASRL